MAKQLMMYEKVTPLNKMQHKDLYLKANNDFGFAAQLNSVPLTAVEFSMAAAEYAIVFTGTEDAMMPCIIMGVNKDENLYVGENGWNAKYLPAFVRRYPFVFSNTEDGEKLMLCIDESYTGFNTDGRGERLFDADGEQTQYLSSILKFMEDYQAHYRHTQLFCKKLVDLELLQPMNATIDIKDEQRRTITGFQGVDRNKLKTLSTETLMELMANDWLELIYLHLQSVRTFGLNIDRIVSKKDVNLSKESTESEASSPELDSSVLN